MKSKNCPLNHWPRGLNPPAHARHCHCWHPQCLLRCHSPRPRVRETEGMNAPWPATLFKGESQHYWLRCEGVANLRLEDRTEEDTSTQLWVLGPGDGTRHVCRVERAREGFAYLSDGGGKLHVSFSVVKMKAVHVQIRTRLKVGRDVAEGVFLLDSRDVVDLLDEFWRRRAHGGQFFVEDHRDGFKQLVHAEIQNLSSSNFKSDSRLKMFCR